ncbi:forkhead box protein N3 isoform X1 [Ictalurus punctatus]|uniref:Forkhead box protein N3 n=1 Tax=Ictalurus punctatus TaxID=7998 RepID=A0A2D0RNY8_ICTPU|nr:forkhead box protein N3 isoform X1 [Ictalurus punctatus]XP_017331670.1 forkhead box protein N3 isoform X1 [Ictalurus punctatus]XP_017331671.1 forkhead box protein N3 isoform X1 [Ictalurus punctatus]XP_047013436.1 forkhead box protein N3 isoform X1 [Ictalurus punctatus]XP_047013437.1 forkhead box protein N3 isoform X1 [Ictalurus punctatus]
MGPVMPPSKKPEASGVSVASGLSQLYQVSSITRALCEDDELELALPVPAIKLEKSGAEDEELTNLNWLHESKNLLTSFGDPVLRSVSPVQEPDDDPPPSPATSDLAYDAKHNPNCKPPYSFSCLIFMAIEDAPSKRLPVKDIYNWILEHFPYFANAPTGWKNSVRHNLSLNKCFKKVDKDRSQSIGKGSLWCIDPEYRHNLIQALKKTPYHPYSQVFTTPPTSPQAYQSLSSPPIWPGNHFYRKNKGVLLPDADIDAAVSMMCLNRPETPEFFPQGVIRNGACMMSPGLFPGIRPLPISPIGSRTAAVRSVLAGCRIRSESEPSCDSPLVSSDPKEDHNYSFGKSSNSTTGEKTPLDCGASEFHGHDAASDTDDDDRAKIKKEPKEWAVDALALAQHNKWHHLTKVKQRVASDMLPLKKRRTEKPPESDDEEMKEAAGSLLHLAGVRACLNNITNRTAKGQKEQKESMKNN